MSAASNPDKTDRNSTTGLSLVVLFIAIGITLAIVIYPHLLANSQQKADQFAAMLMFWSMSAGYVRGVGFIPRNKILRWLLGGTACFVALALAIIRINLV